MNTSQVIAILVAVLCWTSGVRGVGRHSLFRSLDAVSTDAACGDKFYKITPCLTVNTTQCTEAQILIQPCDTWVLSQSKVYTGSQPPTECCSAMKNLQKHYVTCFCLLTFYPPSAFNRTLQEEVPRRCNVTTNLCRTCPPLLTKLPTGNPLPSQTKCVEFAGTKSAARRRYERTRILAWTFSVTGGVLLGISLICFLAIWRRRRALSPQFMQEQAEIARMEGRPVIFSYAVLREATRNFHFENKLGEGGFGEVFKGVLPDGVEVAVKRLVTSSKQGKTEFFNEVSLITSVTHRNLVKLKGCCLKGDERLLVYELLENKSLYQALFDPKYPMYLDWPLRVKIAVGTARGLAYLHEGSQTRIIHRDVKASNILLDKDLEPKISDFGLAKLVDTTQSHISTRVAGTVGYLSPEYALRGQLTEKADVFSYGIVLLELLSGRTNLDLRLTTEVAYLLDWIWQLHEDNRLLDILDPRLKKEDSEDDFRKFAEVALLCTQTAAMRPSMSRVVSMLCGDAAVVIPRLVKPTLRHFDSLKNSGALQSASRKSGESPENAYFFKSSSGSSSNYISGVEPR